MSSVPACRRKLLAAVLLLAAACLAFGLWQNAAPRPGGAISPAKTGWLFLALTHFLLIPAWLWRDASLPASVRRAYGWFFAGYVARGAVEMPLLLWTHAWRPWHGITHNAVMLLLLVCLLRRAQCGAGFQPVRPPAHGFARLLIAALLFESLNAWLFGQTGSAEHGVYFASDEAAFALINTITWGEIALLLPALAWWLWRYLRSA